MPTNSREPELLPEAGHRALLYVERLDAVGFLPDRRAVERLGSGGPRGASYENQMFSGLAGIALGIGKGAGKVVREAESLVDWLIRMGWLTTPGDDRLQLTDLGRALLAGLREAPSTYDPQAEEATAVVLRPDDPFVYSQMTRTIAAANEALLVDPYFKSDMLPWLHDGTRVTRLLMAKSQGTEVELVALMLHEMRETANAGRVEVRATKSSELHDRVIVPAEGSVLYLGTSITGIGRHLSTIVPLPAVAGNAIRSEVERFWGESEPVSPRPVRRPDVTGAG